MILQHEVVGDGSLGGILLIGDVPDEKSLENGKAFTGAYGSIIRKFCASAGITNPRFENVVETIVPLDLLYRDKKKSLPTEELQQWRSDLLDRIKLIKPVCIVAFGRTALWAVTGEFHEIDDVHGYLMPSMDVPVPVIPAIPPNEMYFKIDSVFWIKNALEKARKVAAGHADLPFITYIDHDFQSALDYLAHCAKAKEVSIDIETLYEQPVLTAIGIACDPNTVLSVSKNGDDALTDEQWSVIMSKILDIIRNPKIRKIGQNFMFDSMMLWKIYGVRPEGEIWDTMHVSNIIYSDVRKRLADLGRLYLYRAPWKGNWRETGYKLRQYNAQDVNATFRIKQHQESELKRLNMLDYYQNTTQKLFVPAFDLSVRGIKIDTKARDTMTLDVETALIPHMESVCKWAEPFVPQGQKKKNLRDYEKDIRVQNITDLSTIPEAERKDYFIAKGKNKHGQIEGSVYQKAFKTEIGLFDRAFNPKSSSQVIGVLRNAGVKIPKVKQSHTKEWAESTNDKALKKILERNNDDPNVLAFVRHMLVIRTGQKLITSYCKADIDSDSRWRCLYNIEGTETGRSSSKKTPWATGGNNQNIPREGFQGVKFKKVFVADEGKVFFQSDQEQAEARIVAYLSRCTPMIKLFENNEDIHTYAISHIMGIDMKELKKSNPDEWKNLRQYGKIVNHGGNYDMGPATLSESALKMGIDLPVSKAESFLKARKKVFPEVYTWHKEIQETLHKQRTLVTPFGRRRFFIGKIDKNTYREAYAHSPQSSIPHITNLMWLWACKQSTIEVLQMGHDSLLMQLPDFDLGADSFITRFIEQTKTIRFKIHEFDVNIPWDCSLGKTWAEMQKVKVN